MKNATSQRRCDGGMKKASGSLSRACPAEKSVGTAPFAELNGAKDGMCIMETSHAYRTYARDDFTGGRRIPEPENVIRHGKADRVAHVKRTCRWRRLAIARKT